MADEFREKFIQEKWRNEDGKEAKKRPNNEYIKTITQEEAMAFFENTGAYGQKYHTLKQELDLAYEDLQLELSTMTTLRDEEKDMVKKLNLLKGIEKKKKDGLNLDKDEADCVAKMSSRKFLKIIEKVRENRIKVDKRKEEFSKKVARLEKELEENRHQNANTQVWKEGGVWKKRWTHASDEASKWQSHKKSNHDIGKDFAEMLVTPDGLLNIDYEKSMAKIKAYRDIFPYDGDDYRLYSNIMKDLEDIKTHCSRQAFAARCYEGLDKTNQRTFMSVVETIIMVNKTKKQEFQLPALYSARVNQIRESGNNPKRPTNNKTGAFKKNKNKMRPNFQGQRKNGGQFFRGGRGSFRGNGRGGLSRQNQNQNSFNGWNKPNNPFQHNNYQRNNFMPNYGQRGRGGFRGGRGAPRGGRGGSGAGGASGGPLKWGN